MTRRPIPFSGSAFFLGPAPAPGRTRGPCDDATPPRQGAPAAAARRAKAPARSRIRGREAPGTTPSPLRSALRSHTPRTHSGSARRARPTLPQPLHCPPLLCPCAAWRAPRAGARRCAPRGLTRIQRTFEQTGAAVLFVSDSLLAPVPKVALSPSAFRTPPQPFSPHPAPTPGPADKKSPGSAGQNMRKENSKGGSAKAPLEQRRSTEAAGGRSRTCGSAGGKSAQARTTPSGTNKRQE